MSNPDAPVPDELERARRQKLQRWREEFQIDPYGCRVDGIMPLNEARALFEESSQQAFDDADGAGDDPRQRAIVAGRVIQHRAMGSLVFLVVRDHSGDLQISVSKKAIAPETFKIAKTLDYGDIIVAGGPVGCTKKREICVWADRLEVHCKSLAPPPEKYHGLTDSELRYRHRYVDMYANPETMRTFRLRSQMMAAIRRFMDDRSYLEVETPMLQPIAGGAAARPFTTHHNALDIGLFMRIAPELYLKRLLVGGMPRVYEINRNFRNEGIDRTHNPEFTMLEVYHAFGDCETMLELTESLVYELAVLVAAERAGEDGIDPSGPKLQWDGHDVDFSRPFERISYGELFLKHVGIDMADESAVRKAARDRDVSDPDKRDHWLLVDDLFGAYCEQAIPHERPAFVTDFPSAISPLTRPHPDNPQLSYRWELFIAGMELANAYTELNDPDVQLQRFTEQLAGANEEAQAFRTLDEDFINALKVGMPPAGGLGIGIDRLLMLLVGARTIRDVILFPLLRPEGGT
jgi:lysyl-tRNA synthetase class 2